MMNKTEWHAQCSNVRDGEETRGVWWRPKQIERKMNKKKLWETREQQRRAEKKLKSKWTRAQICAQIAMYRNVLRFKDYISFHYNYYTFCSLPILSSFPLKRTHTHRQLHRTCFTFTFRSHAKMSKCLSQRLNARCVIISLQNKFSLDWKPTLNNKVHKHAYKHTRTHTQSPICTYCHMHNKIMGRKQQPNAFERKKITTTRLPRNGLQGAREENGGGGGWW